MSIPDSKYSLVISVLAGRTLTLPLPSGSTTTGNNNLHYDAALSLLRFVKHFMSFCVSLSVSTGNTEQEPARFIVKTWVESGLIMKRLFLDELGPFRED